MKLTDGALIHYDGKGKGRPVLLVHGWTMSSDLGQRQTDALSDRYQLITMDSRVHGNSSKALDNHRVPRYAKDIRTVIDHLNKYKMLTRHNSKGKKYAEHQ